MDSRHDYSAMRMYFLLSINWTNVEKSVFFLCYCNIFLIFLQCKWNVKILIRKWIIILKRLNSIWKCSYSTLVSSRNITPYIPKDIQCTQYTQPPQNRAHQSTFSRATCELISEPSERRNRNRHRIQIRVSARARARFSRDGTRWWRRLTHARTRARSLCRHTHTHSSNAQWNATSSAVCRLLARTSAGLDVARSRVLHFFFYEWATI